MIIGGGVLSRQTHVCHDKTCLLLWQKYACCDKLMFDVTKLVVTKKKLRQTRVCCDKSFARQAFFCHEKRCVLLRQRYACCDKSFVMTKLCLLRHIFVMTKIFCHEKHNFIATKTFVVTSILLSRQKMCFVATNMCLLWQNLSFLFKTCSPFSSKPVVLSLQNLWFVTLSCDSAPHN